MPGHHPVPGRVRLPGRVEPGEVGAHRAAVDPVVLQGPVELPFGARREGVEDGGAGAAPQQRVDRLGEPVLEVGVGGGAGDDDGQPPVGVAELVQDLVQRAALDHRRHAVHRGRARVLTLGGGQDVEQAAGERGDGGLGGGHATGGQQLGVQPDPGARAGGGGHRERGLPDALGGELAKSPARE